MKARALSLLGHAVVCVTFLAYGGPAGLGLAFVLGLAASIWAGPRFAPGRIATLLAHVGVVAFGFQAARQIDPDTSIPDAVAAGAIAGLVLRKWLREPRWTPAADTVLLLAAMTALGEAHRGIPYGILCLALVTVLVTRTEPGALLRLRARLAPLLGVLVVGGLVAVAIGWALPAFNRLTNRRIASYIAAHARTGFEGRVHLGPASPIYESEDIVMRIDGPTPDYLRGRVFDVLNGSTWYGIHTADDPPLRVAHGGPRTTVSLVWPGRRRFAPLGADVDGVDAVDGYGVLSGAVVGEYSFGPGAMMGTTTDADLRVPETLKPHLAVIAREWTAGAVGDEAKLEAIERHLRTEYRYTLARKPTQGPELLDFLFVSREGHCEYFASALALVARSAGVRTRVATGYRVVEKNPIGDYAVVREKNAHAWVEAWYGGAWHTRDATPPSPGLASKETSAPSALWDYARRRGGTAWEVISATGRRGIVGLVGFVGAMRALVWLIRRRRGGAEAARRPATGEAHPLYRTLERALGRLGVRRPPHETLEELADRIDRDPERRTAAALVRRYAAFRYGGLGDPDAIAADIARLDRSR